MANITKTTRERITPRQFGAKGDTRSLQNTTIEAGSNTVVNTVDEPFRPSDVGALIYLLGGAANNHVLAASVVEYISPSQVVISTNAVTAMFDGRCVVGHDDTLAFTRAMAYVSANAGFGSGSNLFLGDGHYLTGPLLMPAGASLFGNGPYQSVLYLKPGSALIDKYLLKNKDSSANHQAFESFGLNGLCEFQAAGSILPTDIDTLVWTAYGDTLTAVEGNLYRNLRITESCRASIRYDGLGDTKFTDITVGGGVIGFDINAPGNSFSGCSASAQGAAWLLGPNTKSNRFVSCKGFMSGYKPMGNSTDAGDRANWYLNGASQNDFSSCEGQEAWGSNWVLNDAKGNTFSSCRGSDPGCVYGADGLGDNNSSAVRAGWHLMGTSSDTRFAACSVSIAVHGSTSYASHALYMEGSTDFVRGDIWSDMDPEMTFAVSDVGNTSTGENNTEIKINGSGVYVSPVITSSNAINSSHNSTLSHSLTSNQTVNWTITGGADQAQFELSGSTLRWVSNGTKDYENPDDSDGNNTYVVQVTATNPTTTSSAIQTITVTVTLDVAPTITSANSANNPENSTLAHALTADQTVTWAITGGVDAARFSISGSTLRWAGNGTKDYETPNDANSDNIYVVQVTATNATSGLSASQTISITVTDVADVAPTITSTNTATVNENATLSKALTADQTVTWAITGGADQSHFELSGSTLRWAGNGTKDYENPTDSDGNNTYMVQVTATNTTSGLAVAQIVTVTVADVLDIAPTITSTNTASVNENATLSKALTANQTVTWSIVGGQDQTHFEINGGSTLRWAGNGTKDYENPTDVGNNNTYIVTVRATNTSSLYTDQSITVTVLDVLDASPIITSTNTASVAENATLSKTLASNQTVTWSIVGGVDAARFELSGSTLRWVGNGTKDYENPNDADTNNTYIVTVRATNATTSLTTDQTITVTVTDVVDIVPANTVAPSITTNPVITGESVAYTNGTWSYSPDSYTRNWYIGSTSTGPWSPISAPPLTNDQAAQFVRLGVIATNAAGSSTEVFSVARATELPSVVAPTPKRYNFSFRQTATGSTTWNGGGINLGTDVDPNDSENVTSLLITGSDSFPLNTADGELSYGRASGSAPTSSNNSAAQSGNDVLLGGQATLSSRQAYTFDVPGPGDYDVWLASGAGSSVTSEEVMLFDGRYAELTAVLTSTPKVWKTGTAYALNVIAVSLTDLSVWKVGTAGTSGTTAPSGSGPTFTDNNVSWNRLPINALEVFRGSTGTTGYVIDQNNFAGSAAGWRARTPRVFNVTGTYGPGFTFHVDVTSRPRQFGFRAKGAILADATLYNGFGEVAESTPTFYANQPSGYQAYRIAITGGNNSVSAFSLGGDLAPYHTIVSSGGYAWIVANDTRLPDSLAGSRSLTITQTDANSVGSPHTTTFTCNVVSSQSRPTTSSSYLGKISTQNWLKRKSIKTVTDTVWTGYAGQSFASDTLVSGSASFISALASLSPDGTSWYRIRLGAGTYTGKTSGYNLNFGSGGLLIEPASGQDPEFDMSLLSFAVHGVHFRNMRIPCNKINLGNELYMIRMGDPGPTGINGSGKFNKIAVTNCRIGINYGAGNSTTSADISAKYASPFYILHGESFYSKDNRFDGVHVPYAIAGMRAQRYIDNMYAQTTGDIFALGQSDGLGSTIDVFADNDVYIDIQGDSIQKEIDFSGYANSNHLDWVQIRTWNRNLTNWNPNAKPNNLSLTNDAFPYWSVGDRCFNNEPAVAAVYEVVAVSKAEALTGGGTGPEGHGQSIVDGDVTWKWIADYVWDNDMHMIMENVTVNSASPIAGVAARQAFINSNGRHRSNCHLVANNNIYGSYSGYGIGQTDGDVFAEFNTFVGPSQLKSTSSPIRSTMWVNGNGKLFSAHNIVQMPSYIDVNSAKRHAYDEVIVGWTSSIASPGRPIDQFEGSFEQDSTSRWTYPSLKVDGSYTLSEFTTAMRALFITKEGITAGARPLEGADVPPVITSTNTASVAENATLSKSLTADQTVTWTISGGADQTQFELSSSTLRWVGNGTKDYESPNDADANNTYIVQVTATSSSTGMTSSQTITVTVTDVAEGSNPSITSTNTASVAENATLSKALTSNQTVTWSLVGGSDQAQFEISGSTLRWASNGTKDFESPADADANNTYIVIVRATNSSTSLYSDQTITVTVTDVLDVAPTITSTNTASVAENTTLSKSLTSDQTVTWSITGGADAARFELSGSTLRWLSDGTKDYENPNDADTNNTYIVQVTATNTASLTTNQTITVTVTDVSETNPTITSANTRSVNSGATLSHALTSDQTVTWSIIGGSDQAQFELSGSTLRWVSDGTQSHGSPSDSDLNNTYVVQVRATNTTTGLTASQTITVTVVLVTVIPSTQSVNFGTKTRVGLGGHPCGYTGTGYLFITTEKNADNTDTTHWRFDERNHLVPRNGATTTYGSTPPTYSTAYTLTVRETSDSAGTTPTGVTGTINIVMLDNAMHAREMYGVAVNADSTNTTTGTQVTRYLTTGGTAVRGDTIWMRDGVINPQSEQYRLRPRTGIEATGDTSKLIWIKAENALQSQSGGWQIENTINGLPYQPVGFDGIDFVADTNSAWTTAKYLVYGGQAEVKNCRFRTTSNITTPANVRGADFQRVATATNNQFINTGIGINLKDTYDIVIENNSFSGAYGTECITGWWHGSSSRVRYNIAYDKKVVAGSFIRHSGVQKRVQIGTGNGSQTNFTGTLGGAPIYFVTQYMMGTNIPTTVTTGTTTLSGSGLTGSTINKTTGAYSITFTTAPASGVPIYIDYKAENEDGKFEGELGEISYNIGIRNNGVASLGDFQLIYFGDTYGWCGARADIRNNLGLTTAANSVFVGNPSVGYIRFNTGLNDYAANHGFTSNALLYGEWSADLTVTNNLFNTYNFDNAVEGLIMSPNPQQSMTKTWTAYNAAFPTLTSTFSTPSRAAILAAFTPGNTAIASGGVKNTDGTFNGALFPATAGNTVGAWNDGSVYEPSNPTWVAAHPPAA